MTNDNVVSSLDIKRQQKIQEDFFHKCTVLKNRLQDMDFLSNKGLGNEIGFFTFCHDPSLEFRMRSFINDICEEADRGVYGADGVTTRIIHINLYDKLLEICEKKRILAAIPKQELKRGSAFTEKQLAKIATPEAFAEVIDYESHQLGDVLIITGVGEVYPFLRTHVLLDNLQHRFGDVPVVVMYPGVFSGRDFSLFGRFNDGNYYRAFDLV